MLKKLLFLTTYTLALTTCTLQAQDWQWIQRGGSYTNFVNNLQYFEAVIDIKIDSDNNSYILSSIGHSQPDIAGNPVNFYGSNTANPDFVLASFSCDGTFRWSKTLGGNNRETIESIGIDANDNIYIAGQFLTCILNNPYAPHIDEDFIFDQSTTPLDCRMTFITKYDKDGNFQWVQRPSPVGGNTNDMGSMNIVTTPNGTSHWLVVIDAPGTYAGSLNYPGGENGIFIFKYDTDGNFIEAIPLNIDVSDGGLVANMKLYINPNNGYYYLTSRETTSSGESLSIQGQTLTGTSYIACFNTTGTLQYMIQNTTATHSLNIHSIIFDDQNNMYIDAQMSGDNLDTFMGITIPEFMGPDVIIKTDAATASNVFWYTYANQGANGSGSLVYDHNQNVLVYTGRIQGAVPYTWGSQTVYPSSYNGSRPMMATFNPSNGDCNAIHYINGQSSVPANARVLAIDNSGDYVMGGDFSGYLYDTNGNSIYSVGGNRDFFLTKFSTQACTPLSTQNNQAINLQPYPNPTFNNINVPVTQQTSYALYNIQGALLQQGTLNTNNQSVPLNNYPAGMYLLTLTTANGQSQTHKIIKQ
ncbi:T9SS type A sorting domain-containing protein [Neptunitalea lumnitzerae]|uniref:Secretion system C-terminal sorting domain-containing protein n=1 Tax=Neptunitalea lumnitzerae TaxID=2965509 RepID=A0ABQ5MNX8_9FLAO|nr:T9SS type A sorting domain-containing protein [Neptunitalea sp. Y10]GLB50810.1 hypothetical protein Y10_31780 [Neptunitalea sp. Y10]